MADRPVCSGPPVRTDCQSRLVLDWQAKRGFLDARSALSQPPGGYPTGREDDLAGFVSGAILHVDGLDPVLTSEGQVLDALSDLDPDCAQLRVEPVAQSDRGRAGGRDRELEDLGPELCAPTLSLSPRGALPTGS